MVPNDNVKLTIFQSSQYCLTQNVSQISGLNGLMLLRGPVTNRVPGNVNNNGTY